jgi:hypothetical protein
MSMQGAMRRASPPVQIGQGCPIPVYGPDSAALSSGRLARRELAPSVLSCLGTSPTVAAGRGTISLSAETPPMEETVVSKLSTGTVWRETVRSSANIATRSEPVR